MAGTTSVCLTAVIFCAVGFASKSLASSRVERHVEFPKGTSFTVTVAMSTFLPKDVLLMKIPTGLAHIVEYDFAYPFPEYSGLNRSQLNSKQKLKKKKNNPVYFNNQLWEPPYTLPFSDKRKWKTKRKGKILEQLSRIIDRHGYNGDLCIERLGCEAHQHLAWDKSLLEDIILAAIPPPESPQNCKHQILQDCPVSLLQILLHSEPLQELKIING